MEEKIARIKLRLKGLEQYKIIVEASDFILKEEKLIDTNARIAELEFVILLLEENGGLKF